MGGRNINDVRYADDATPMAEREEELKNLLIRVEESERAGLKLNIQKPKIMSNRWGNNGNRWGNNGNSDRLHFLGL